MAVGHGKFVITFNGEIYNFRARREPDGIGLWAGHEHGIGLSHTPPTPRRTSSRSVTSRRPRRS